MPPAPPDEEMQQTLERQEVVQVTHEDGAVTAASNKDDGIKVVNALEETCTVADGEQIGLLITDNTFTTEFKATPPEVLQIKVFPTINDGTILQAILVGSTSGHKETQELYEDTVELNELLLEIDKGTSLAFVAILLTESDLCDFKDKELAKDRGVF